MLKHNPNCMKDKITNVNFHDPELYKHMGDKLHENNKNIDNFLIALALCHTVIH